MKFFYIITLGLVIALALLPMMLLEGQADDYKGLIVRYSSYGAPVRSIDPATCGDTTSSGIQANFYEGLYCYHYLKRPLEVIPLLAESMPKVSEDGLTYTIKLKKGVKYHRNPCFGKDDDGSFRTRTVHAKDFVMAFKRVADYHLNTGLAWAFLANRIAGIDDYRKKTRSYKVGDFSRYNLPLEGIKALDEHTLQIKLVEAFPQLICTLAMHVYAPIPREAVDYWLATEDDGNGGRKSVATEKRATEFREAEQAVGTGPYVLAVFKRKSKIVLKRNHDFRKDYYPSEGEESDKEAGLLDDAGKLVPFIDVLHIDYVAEDYSSWMRFLTKQTDSSGIPKEPFEFVISPDKKLADKWQKQGIQLTKYHSPAVYWIVFNMDDPVIGKSKSLRQALCLCYDVDNHIKILFNGRGKRAVSILPSTFKGHKEAGPGPYARFDLEAAKKKLSKAKEELAQAGELVNGEIPELVLDLPGRDRSAYRMGEFVQQQFGQLNIKLKLVGNDWDTLQEKVHNKQVQIYTMGWHADYPDAENFLQLFYTGNIDKQTNNSNYSNKEFDRLYEKIRTMDDSPERTKLYAKMINIISEDCPVLLLSEPENYVLIYDWVKNSKPHPIGSGFSKYVRIDTELRAKLGGRKR